MAITINVKGYEKPFTFPDGTPQEEIEAALRTIPPAPVNPAKEALAVADTGVRGSLTALPGLFADTITGQSPTQRKLTTNAIGAMLPKPVGDFLREKMTRNWKEPLTPMAPSEALQMGMQTPQTELGKMSADVTAGVTGAFMPGGQFSTGMKVAQGVGSGLGAYLGEKVGGPVGSFVGGALGGGVPAVANRFRPDAGNIANEILHNIGPEQFDDIVAAMRHQEQKGFPINASQAASFPSNLDAAIERLAKGKAGQAVQDQLNAQPRHLQLQGMDILGQMPGKHLGQEETNRLVQIAATGAIEIRDKAARTAWQTTYKRMNGDAERIPQEAMREFAAKLQAIADNPKHTNTAFKDMAEAALQAIKDPKQPAPLPGLPGRPNSPYSGVGALPSVPGSSAQTVYIEHPVAVRDAIEKAVSPFTQANLSTSSADSKLIGQQKQIRKLYSELVEEHAPALREANKAMSTVIRESADPAREGVLGRLAGARGAQEGEVSPSKIYAIFDRGTPIGPGARSEILQAEREMRKVNPMAFINAAKAWTTDRFGKAFDKSTNSRLNPNLGSVLREAFGNPAEPSPRWQGTRDIFAGAARSAGLDERAVVKGIEEYVRSAGYAAQRPSRVGMMQQADISELTGAEGLRRLGKVNPFTPFRMPAFWTADVLDHSVLKSVAENLTSADGLLKLQQLARTRPDSPVREALLRSLTGATAATNAASSSP